jgi:anti-sigma regulatory factor (Ser/Thr protein kinase)
MDAIHRANPDLSHVDLVIDFWADHAQSKIIRDFVGAIFEFHQIRTPWGGRFILITDELINNAIEHGSSEGDLDTCIIKAFQDTLEGFQITLEVHDTGNGKDGKKATEMSAVKESHTSQDGTYMEKRGRGLFHITEKLVDRLEFRESPRWGLAVRIEKVIPSSDTWS